MRDPVAVRAETHPSATALIDAGDDRRWSYRELDAAVDRAADCLAAAGVGSGDRVAVLQKRQPAFVWWAFATWRRGAVLAPLHGRLDADGLDDQVDVVAPSLLVCGGGTERRAVAAATCPVVSVDEPTAGADPVEAMTDDGRESGGAADPVEALPDDGRESDDGAAARETPGQPLDRTRVVLFTSGTTGDPGAVRLTGRNLLASAVTSGFRTGVLPGDRWLCPLPLYHAGGLSVPIRTAVYGTTAVLGGDDDPGSAVSTLRTYRPALVSLVAAQLRDLIEAGDELPGSLRVALVGGGPVDRDLVERAHEASIPACPTYGLTETASQVATARPDEAAAHPETVGRPLAWTRVTVVDADGEPCETGEVGEVAVDGPTVSPGYLGDRTARRSEHGLLTGDLGERDGAGRLRIHGRVDDRIRTGGETVVAGPVADTLEAHPDVAEAAVVGVADQRWGERVAALVVPDANADPDPDLLREHCRDALADFEVPRTVATADDLPRTPSGTVDRDAVREQLRSPGDGSDGSP